MIGQSQHAAEVICGSIYFEFAAASKRELLEHFPILNILDEKSIFCGDPSPGKADDFRGHGDAGNFFGELSDRAQRNEKVEDSDVREALRKLFKAENSKAHVYENPFVPFIHTHTSLQIMGKISHNINSQNLSSELDDTCNLQSCMPILLKGDTGTGKTYLLFKYLQLLHTSGALKHLCGKAKIITLSAKFLRPQVEGLGRYIKETVSESRPSPDAPSKLCSFILDEVFTPKPLLLFFSLGLLLVSFLKSLSVCTIHRSPRVQRKRFSRVYFVTVK